jgi:hypothetical protein
MRRLTLLAAFLLAVASARAGDLQILFPLYSYPNWYQPASYIWDDVAAAASTVPITAIINPNNGPDGGAPNSDYVHGMGDLAAGGVTMIGYVYTSYGNTTLRPLADIKTDIDLYDQFYTGVSGIFLDEVSSDSADVAYYQAIYDYIQAKPNLTKVFANPGTNTDEGYISGPAADTTVIFENTSGWSGYVPDSYVVNYSNQKFAGLFLNIPTVAGMEAAVDLAVERNIGYVFATNDTTPNPFNSLPSYWADEVAYVASVPEPSALAFCAVGALLALRRGRSALT